MVTARSHRRRIGFVPNDDRCSQMDVKMTGIETRAGLLEAYLSPTELANELGVTTATLA